MTFKADSETFQCQMTRHAPEVAGEGHGWSGGLQGPSFSPSCS
jgi:hypothetical protein